MTQGIQIYNSKDKVIRQASVERAYYDAEQGKAYKKTYIQPQEKVLRIEFIENGEPQHAYLTDLAKEINGSTKENLFLQTVMSEPKNYIAIPYAEGQKIIKVSSILTVTPEWVDIAKD